MFVTLPTDPEKRKKAVKTAAKMAIWQCEDYVARGSPPGPAWCDFLDREWINSFAEEGSKKNARKQGPLGGEQGYKHLGVLVEDFVDFGLGVYAGVSPALPVRVLHGHAETV